MKFDPMNYPYPSRRVVSVANRGMVATSQALAAQAGLEILKLGGNAVGAAVATAAALTVVEPTSNGLGGDAFAIVAMGDELYGLNSSGPAPRRLTAETVRAKGHSEMPSFGWFPVTVPGVVAGWIALWRAFGSLTLKELLRPAIAYAAEGYPLSPTLAAGWKAAFRVYSRQGSEFAEWLRVFAPEGQPPECGEIWKSLDHARTLELIAETEGEAFYRGELAERIHRYAEETDGFLRYEDLSSFEPEWVEPLSVRYHGFDVWELPPNGQGLVALIALGILDAWEFSSKEGVDTYHRQIEALKLAMTAGKAVITERQRMPVEPEELLDPAYLASLRGRIRDYAQEPEVVIPKDHGTVYLATADRFGNMVSFIQSNYMGFGSGLVVPGTGIALQNRGAGFSLNPQDANYLEPGKRSYHTIIPGFLTRDGRPVGPFGVMGGFMQPQGHLQVVMNTVDFGLNPQAALDAPRWQWLDDDSVELEETVPSHIKAALARKGHKVTIPVSSAGFGRGQIIWRDSRGVLMGGTEPRCDSAAAVW
jgi:gamma-glutamyltranspeptidase/glutathione hydrolase